MNYKLALHFDINKTILISDHDVNTDSMLNSILSECVWGEVGVEDNRFGHRWNLRAIDPQPDPPICSNYVSFGEYLDKQSTLPKDIRKKLKATFTLNGHVGELCRPSFILLKAALEPLTSSLSVYGIELLIIPSFYKMFLELSLKQIDFTVIFRTFGFDIDKVATELNLFCEGRHPLHPLPAESRLDGSSPGLPDRRLHLPTHSACVKRFNATEHGIHFASINPTAVSPLVQITRGVDAAWQTLGQWVQAGALTMSIQDDFDWWDANDER